MILPSHHLLILSQDQVIRAQRDAEDDGRHPLKTVDPLLSLGALASHIEHPAEEKNQKTVKEGHLLAIRRPRMLWNIHDQAKGQEEEEPDQTINYLLNEQTLTVCRDNRGCGFGVS